MQFTPSMEYNNLQQGGERIILTLKRGLGFPGSSAGKRICLQCPVGSDSKESSHDVGDLGLIPGLGRSPGEGNGNVLQYSCLENSMDRGAWWVTVHRVPKSQTSSKLKADKNNCISTSVEFSGIWSQEK